MNNRKVLRAKRLLIPLVLSVVVLLLWLGAIDARAQSDYFLIPAVIYDHEVWSDPGGNAGGGFLVSGNSLSMDGSCTYDGGWTDCGAAMAVARPLDVDAVLGFVIDWSDATVDTQTHARPQAFGFDLSGNGSVFGGNSGCANVALCPSPYTGRWCMTDVDPGALTHLDCDEEPDIWLTDAVTGTNDSLAVYGTNTTGGTLDLFIDVELYWLVLECPEGHLPDGNNICQEYIPPPATGPVDPGATCSFNYTSTITTTNGTGTATYSYTVPANLVANYSFEDDDGAYPSNWTVWGYEPPIGVFTPLFYGSGIFDARTGLDYVRLGRDFNYQLIQDMTLYSGGIYQAGFYYKCGAAGGSCSAFNAANLNWGGTQVASVLLNPSTPITIYQAISGTRATGGGSAWLTLEMFGSTFYDDEIFVDDLFIWPVDESGDILCDPDYYPVPPGQPVTSTVPSDQCAIVFGGLCFPTVGDASCWDCQRPTSLIQIGEWIAWLLCQIRNLFFCHLYQWILVTANWITGLYQNIVLFFQWIPTVMQNALSWLGNVWDTGIGWINEVWGRVVTGFTNWLRVLVQNILNSSFVQAVFNFVAGVSYVWDLFVSLIELFLDMLQAIYNGILDLISLVINLVLAVREALLAEAYDWDFLPGFSGETEVEISREAAIADEGGATWSETQAIYIFLMALGAGDAVLAEFGIQYIQFLIIGAISIGLIWWTLRKWEYILPV